MKSISFKGKRVAYEQEGRGFPVVLLHGFCEDSWIWADFKQDLLEENYRVITIDLPGFGDSEPVEAPSIKYYAEAVAAVLVDRQLEEVVVIGHSMGGYTALALAEIIPERLRGIGLFHSHPYADSEERRQARQKQITFIERYGQQLFVKQLVPHLFSEAHKQSNPFDVDKIIHRAARYSAQGIVGGLQAMANRPDRSSVLKTVACPVLFIVGEEDTAVPPENSEAQLVLPTIASIHILPRVGHMGMIESMRPTQLIVRQFVDFCLR